jgi:hypothetical protein
MKRSEDKVDQLIRSLAVIDENIRAEAIAQATLFIEASRYRVECMRVRMQAEAEFEAFSSKRWLVIREKKSQVSKERITNDQIKSQLQIGSNYRRLKAAVNRAEAEEEFSKLLLEAYRMRRDALKILADAQGYEASKQTAELEKDMIHRKMEREARRLYSSRQRDQE